jgi:serine/threonine protein kinase
MDYLPGDTLDNFLAYNSRTISALTKFYILLQILQTLRFLSSNGVVHLDIKEKNIIIMKNIVSKIFDFGESYQYKVCRENHKAKYTTIYGCP